MLTKVDISTLVGVTLGEQLKQTFWRVKKYETVYQKQSSLYPVVGRVFDGWETRQ